MSGYFHNPEVTEDWPDDEDLRRAHVKFDRGKWFCKGWTDAVLTSADTENPHASFQTRLQSLGGTEKYLLENIEVTEEAIGVIATNLQLGRVRVVLSLIHILTLPTNREV